MCLLLYFKVSAAITITFLRDNGIGLSQLMVGVAGLGGSLLFY